MQELDVSAALLADLVARANRDKGNADVKLELRFQPYGPYMGLPRHLNQGHLPMEALINKVYRTQSLIRALSIKCQLLNGSHSLSRGNPVGSSLNPEG